MSKFGRYAKALLRDAVVHEGRNNDTDRPRPDAPPITPYTGGPVPKGHLVLVDQYGVRRITDLKRPKRLGTSSSYRKSHPIRFDGSGSSNAFSPNTKRHRWRTR